MALQHHGAPFLLSTGFGTIDVVDRQNRPTEAQVKALAELIAQDGYQRDAILVRRVTSNTYKVVCGATRVLALRLLNWPKVRAQLVSSAYWSDYQIAELSDDLSSKQLTRGQQAETARKLKELRQKAAAEAGNVAKAKGGRGKRGGVAEAARQAGVPRTTARDHAKKPGGTKPTRQVSDRSHQLRSAEVIDRCVRHIWEHALRTVNELDDADQRHLIAHLEQTVTALKVLVHEGGGVERPKFGGDPGGTVIPFPGAQS
jgi:hypothetical protein